MRPFVHLNVRSVYSFREGAIRLDELATATRAHGMPAVALTDRDTLAGAVRFTQACDANGITPIYGARLTVGDDPDPAKADERTMITVLARDDAGYANLCKLITAAHHNGERGDPCASRADVARYSRGLFGLLGPGSDVGRALEARRDDDARTYLRGWLEAFGFHRTRIEVATHLRPGDRGRIMRTLAFADENRVTAVATNAARSLSKADAFLGDVLDAMRNLVPIADHHRIDPTHEATLKTPDEMDALFGWRPDLLDESYAIADACSAHLRLGKIQVPNYPPGTARDPDARSLNEMLARRCIAGLARRGLANDPRARDLLEAELAMCARLGFAGYFLTISDLVARVKRMGVRCACRGSAAGSLIVYLTGISEVNPVEHDLVFERFMNPHRTTELPDIDLDVESARREDVYREILGAFRAVDPDGPPRVACVAMVDTYRARGAIREVGKALGLPQGEVDVVAKSFPHISASGIRAALERLPELQRSSLNLGQLEMLFGVAERLDGFPRHLALHPSGILIGRDDLFRVTPLERSAAGFPMSQFDKDDIEALGLLKLDVLGVRMLSSLTHATREIARATGEQVDLDTIDREDPATFDLICASRTLGTFQIESPGQRELLAKLEPRRFKDLITEISLFRPGPVRSDMIGPYLLRRHGHARAAYAHPEVRRFLAETFGVIVYHEQVMRAISAVTGCDLGYADLVRRRLDRADTLDEIEAWFFAKGRANGWRDGEIGPLWREVASFASFGFCKAHAAAFAVPTYQSSWMKTHHPAAFFAGILTHEPGMYPRRTLIDDARHEGVPNLPLDINASGATYAVERTPDGTLGVRIALQHVDGISTDEISAIVAAREERPFTGLADLCRRARISRPTVEALIHAGALDAFGRRRDQLLLVSEFWAGRAPKPGSTQQELVLRESVTEFGLRAYTDAEKVRAELEVLGVDASRHVVSFYTDVLRALGATPSRELRKQRQGARVMVAGVKVASQTPAVRSGQRIIFITLDDGTGLSDATVFESVQEHCAYTVFHSWLLVVRGTLRKTGAGRGGISINAERAWDLSQLAREHKAGSLDIDALWTEGVAEIEEAERARVAARRGRGAVPVVPDGAGPLVPIGERQPRYRPRTGEVDEAGAPAAAAAVPLPARRGPIEGEPAAAGAPRKLWHASGGSAGA